MRLVVVVQAYPTAQAPSVTAYAHSRNLWYRDHGVDVTVASFAARDHYEFEGIAVRPWRAAHARDADLLVAHAPNIRNHARVLWQSQVPVVSFFHGFEALRTAEHYPSRSSSSGAEVSASAQQASTAYDRVKLPALGRLVRRLHGRGGASIFVSDWMRREFLRSVPGGAAALAGSDHVIPNAVHASFVGLRHHQPSAPAADLVTFRPTIDQPKYAVDVVVDLARANPALSFDVFGRGELLRHLGTPPNVRHHDRVVGQAEMAELATRYRAALIPSRLDAQGVTACELATTGMPTFVSDLAVAHDVLGGFANVAFLPASPGALGPTLDRLIAAAPSPPHADFLPSTTCAAELAVFSAVVDRADHRRAP